MKKIKKNRTDIEYWRSFIEELSVGEGMALICAVVEIANNLQDNQNKIDKLAL